MSSIVLVVDNSFFYSNNIFFLALKIVFWLVVAPHIHALFNIISITFRKISNVMALILFGMLFFSWVMLLGLLTHTLSFKNPPEKLGNSGTPKSGKGWGQLTTLVSEIVCSPNMSLTKDTRFSTVSTDLTKFFLHRPICATVIRKKKYPPSQQFTPLSVFVNFHLLKILLMEQFDNVGIWKKLLQFLN